MNTSKMPRDLRTLTRRVLACTGMMVAMVGCSDSLPTDPLRDATTALAQLDLNYKAIVLSVHAPYDTVRLDAVARNLYGDSLVHISPLTFRRASLLDSAVSVDSTGLVRARFATNSTKVLVSLMLNGSERTDTVTIMVRNESPVQKIARLEFFPRAPDSVWRWVGTAGTPHTTWVRLYNPQGQQIANNRAILAFWSSDLEVYPINNAATYTSAKYSSRIVGESWLRVKFYAYDTAFHDSVLYRRIEPPFKFVVIDRIVPVNGPPSIVFYPSRLEVTAGTTVIFMNRPGLRESPNNAGSIDFVGNRIVRATNYGDYVHEWVDSTGIMFDAPPGPVLAGNSFASTVTITLQDFSGRFPSDGGTGNIPNFAWTRCLQVNTANNTVCPGGSGNPLTLLLDSGYRSRRFTTPGEYPYSATAFPGAGGTIVVKP